MSESESTHPLPTTETPTPTPTIDLSIKIYTVDKEEWRIKFGQITEQHYSAVIEALTTSYQSLRGNSSCMLVDENNVVHIFNMDNVTCIQIERRD